MPDEEPQDAAPEKAAMTISMPQTLVVAVVTAVLSSLGTSGGLTLMSGSTPDDVKSEVTTVRSEVTSLKHDIERLSEKIDDIYTIVDRAHPRTP
jgi:peptidoglycan hydrolase CwlO-like protein